MYGGQLTVADIERLQKGFDLVLGGQMAQADAPGGKGVAPVLTDRQHCPGGQSIGRTGRFDRDAHPTCVQLPLEYGALYALHTQVQDMRHSVCRAVDAHFWIAGKLCTQSIVQTADGCGAGGKFRSSLSQGQRQLISIARAAVADPPALILDEATSSIDTRTEIKIQNAFAKMMQGRTSFIVAHRLSTIREADIILVMKDGSIIEQGNHEELLTRGGFYADLYNSQFESTTEIA